MNTIYRDDDADLARLRDRPIAIIGFGGLGRAHALNLRDSGLDVRVGLSDGSKSWAKAEAEGLSVKTVHNAAHDAQILVLLTPDARQPALYRDWVSPHLSPGKTLLFAHGFSLRYGQITPPSDVDVVVLASKALGHRVRSRFIKKGGIPAVLAVHQDASGHALKDALAYAKALGHTRAGVLETSVSAETETALFAEHAVLRGGVATLAKTAFDMLTEAGCDPGLAYFTCLNQLRSVVDELYEHGLTHMRTSACELAEYGDYLFSGQILNDEARVALLALQKSIRDGTFAKHWIAENQTGKAHLERLRRTELEQPFAKAEAEWHKKIPRWE